MEKIFVLRLVTVAGINFECYFKTHKAVLEAHKTVSEKMKTLEKVKESERKVSLFVDVTDDFGIRQMLDVAGALALIITDTESSVKTVSAIDNANDAAGEKHGRKSQTGFQRSVPVVTAPPLS